jgi:hypothetical protein
MIAVLSTWKSQHNILRHICSMQDLWSQRRGPLLSNGFANNHVPTATIGHNNGKRWFIHGPRWDIISRTSLETVKLVESCCSRGRGQFGNPEQEERPPLEAVTRRLVKTQQTEKT